MNDKIIEAIKTFIDTKTVDSSTMKYYLVVFIIVNIVVFLANSIFQMVLKGRDSKESIRTLRNEKRLIMAEKLYQDIHSQISELFEISNTLEPKKSLLVSKISDIRNWIDLNSICLGSRLENKAIEILDYITVVVSDPKMRNLPVEIKLLKEYRKIYETL